jgi:putative lipoprotein (rSAM/lipoprotein system)
MFGYMKQNWKRKLLGGLSITSALFIFQACYGTPQDIGLDIFIQGKVISQKTSLPVKGIRVSVEDKLQYIVTDTDGKFSFYTETAPNYKIKFEDIDTSENGNFIGKDTVLNSIDKRVYLNIVLQEK